MICLHFTPFSRKKLSWMFLLTAASLLFLHYINFIQSQQINNNIFGEFKK